MNRDDWIWVAVRVFGIYLLVLALMSLPESIVSALAARALWRFQMEFAEQFFTAEKAATFRQVALERQLTNSFSSALRVIVFGGVGLYLVRSGKLLFRWVRPPSWEEGGAAEASTDVAAPDGAQERGEASEGGGG